MNMPLIDEAALEKAQKEIEYLNVVVSRNNHRIDLLKDEKLQIIKRLRRIAHQLQATYKKPFIHAGNIIHQELNEIESGRESSFKMEKDITDLLS